MLSGFLHNFELFWPENQHVFSLLSSGKEAGSFVLQSPVPGSRSWTVVFLLHIQSGFFSADHYSCSEQLLPFCLRHSTAYLLSGFFFESLLESLPDVIPLFCHRLHPPTALVSTDIFSEDAQVHSVLSGNGRKLWFPALPGLSVPEKGQK